MGDPGRPDAAAAPVVALRGISKRFGAVQALDGVSFDVWAGETHMLLGENGAGKSTLMKVLCGACRADEGEILHRGAPVRVASPADARALGVAVIFQEFSLVPHLDVAHNVFLGRYPKRASGLVDEARLYREAREVLARIGLPIDPREPVHALGVAQQQIVEIAKALSQDARVLVMDEPTAALSDRESRRLFDVMAKLKADGVAIIYISHRMAEVFALGDRISVLRDGRLVKSLLPGEAEPAELVRLMVGRAVDMAYPRRFREPGEVVLDVRALSAPSGIADISLTVRAGEIVGLAGLVGSGRTEVARAVFGADAVAGGEIHLFGAPFRGRPEDAVRRGMALIPESRKAEGLALRRSVLQNLVSAGLPSLFRSGVFAPGRAARVAHDVSSRVGIAPRAMGSEAGTLSGGNQQKVVIGKWLAAEARLFVFDEPTRGIDVGAKAQIFALIDDLVAAGAGVLMISSEQAEIVHVCDRAYVMRGRRIVGQLGRGDLSEENIVRMSMSHE